MHILLDPVFATANLPQAGLLIALEPDRVPFFFPHASAPIQFKCCARRCGGTGEPSFSCFWQSGKNLKSGPRALVCRNDQVAIT